jgi:hypothetical protein
MGGGPLLSLRLCAYFHFCFLTEFSRLVHMNAPVVYLRSGPVELGMLLKNRL